MTLSTLYILGMWATAFTIVFAEPERRMFGAFFLSVLWPIWVLVMVQISIEEVIDE